MRNLMTVVRPETGQAYDKFLMLAILPTPLALLRHDGRMSWEVPSGWAWELFRELSGQLPTGMGGRAPNASSSLLMYCMGSTAFLVALTCTVPMVLVRVK